MAASPNLIARIMFKAGLRKTAEQKERRRSKRHRIQRPVRFRMYLPSRPKDRSPELPAQLYDISEHGLGLLTDSILWEGLHMIDPDMQTSEKSVLEIEIPYGDQSLWLKGRAVWYIRHPEGIPFVFRVGIEFIDLTPEQRRTVRQLIDLHVAAAEIA